MSGVLKVRKGKKSHNQCTISTAEALCVPQ